MTDKKPKPYKAEYKGATPRQVAESVLRYRPEAKPKSGKKKSSP